MTKYWRFRFKNGAGDFTEQAWERSEFGVWYGAWSADDLREALLHHEDNPQKYLMGLPCQKNLDWEIDVSSALRLSKVEIDDWAVTYLKNPREIGLGKISSEIQSSQSHPLNANGEIYKFRNVSEKKTFKLDDLPDAYQLLSSQGRGNVHQFNAMHNHVKLLAECDDAQSVNEQLKAMKFDQLLDFLGASAWESFCLAYLMLEKNFLPTGLSTGRTLPIADIIGRNRQTGSRIIAQCKKNSYPVAIEENFYRIAEQIDQNAEMIYFSYGGCSGNISNKITVIDRNFALNWAQTENGSQYQRLLLAD